MAPLLTSVVQDVLVEIRGLPSAYVLLDLGVGYGGFPDIASLQPPQANWFSRDFLFSRLRRLSSC